MHIFVFLIFHPFFQGGQLTPFAPMCGRPCMDWVRKLWAELSFEKRPSRARCASIFLQTRSCPVPLISVLPKLPVFPFSFFSHFSPPHLPQNPVTESLDSAVSCSQGPLRLSVHWDDLIFKEVFQAGESCLVMITIRLLAFHLDNLFGSTNRLDPTDLKSGWVRTQGPGGNRHLCM